MWQYNYSPELYHHGIKGQKWGIRRYQNPDGSLTPEGLRRYGFDSHGKAIGSKGASSMPKGLSRSERSMYKFNTGQKKKSKHRLKLEEKYKKLGMTDSEAALAAHKRIKTEKILGAALGMTVAAAGAYVAHKHIKYEKDMFIDTTEKIHNISLDSNKGVQDAFYGAFKDKDRLKYRGLYGGYELQLNNPGKKDVYDTSMAVKEKLKIAGNKNATKVIKELAEKDKNFKYDYLQQLSRFSGYKTVNPKQQKIVEKALKAASKGKINRNTYLLENLILPHHDKESQDIHNRIFEALKAKGYDGIKDYNDMKVSGYKSSKPVVIFNGAKKLAVDSRKKLDEDTLGNEFEKAQKLLAKQYLLSGGAGLAAEAGATAVGTIAGVKGISKVAENKRVRNYLNEHPNTTKSYREIVEIVNGKNKKKR